jgi:hypothetical protein
VKFFLHFYASYAPEAGSVGKSANPGCRKQNLSFLRLNFAIFFNFSFQTAQALVNSMHDTEGLLTFSDRPAPILKGFTQLRKGLMPNRFIKKNRKCPFSANISDYLPPLVAFTFRSLCQMA